MDWEKQQDQDASQGGYVPLAPGSAPAGSAGGTGGAPDDAAASKKKRAVIIAVLVLLVVVAIAVFAWWNATRTSDTLATDPNVKVGSLTGNTEDLDKIVDEGMLTFSINSTPVFDDGGAPGNLMIENPDINNNRFTVTITRDDNGQIIYESGALDPGQYIDGVPLDVSLPAGEYTCTATFNTFKLSDDTPIGQAAAGLTITVLN